MVYENMVSETAKIISTFSDFEGGLWALALFCELLQELCTTQNWSAAKIIRRKMNQVAETEYRETEMNREELFQFAGILTEGVEEAL